MNPNNSFSVSVLLHKDGDAWVAQCLDFDVAAQGGSVPEAKENFLKTLAAQVFFDLQDGKRPFEGLERGPPNYFNHLGAVVSDGPDLPVLVPKENPVILARFLKAA